MARMHATEGRGSFYDYIRLDGIALTGESGECFDRAYAYAFKGGCLNLGGAEAAVAAVPAQGRRFRALTEAEVQAAAQAKLGESGPLGDFVLAAVHDQAARLAREARLCADSIPFAWPQTTVIGAGDR